MHHLYAVGLDGFIPFYSFFPLNLYKANRARVASATSSADIKDTNHVKVILFGSILGDGQLEMPPRGKNARFGFTQSELKKDYFISVHSSLSLICSAKYREYSYYDKRTGKVYKTLNFWSRSLPLLTELYDLFYKDKVKKVPNDLSLLTPLALAHWLMQDGAKGTCKGLYICTDCFTFTDVQRLTSYLTETYNLRCSIHKAQGNYRIYILAKSVQTVRDLVLPYMHPSMLYKLGI